MHFAESHAVMYVAWEPFTIKMKHIPEPVRSVFFPIFFYQEVGMNAVVL